MKNSAFKGKTFLFKTLVAFVLLACIIAVTGCNNSNDITKDLNTYKNEDTSYITRLADYRNFKITKNVSVSSDDVNKAYLDEISELSSRNDLSVTPPVMDPIFEKFAALVAEDKLSENGDFICFDYDGSLDGEPLSGAKASFQYTWLGSGHFIPGFEESIVGHKAGTTFPITVTFPSSYPQNTDLENKEVVFEITLRYILPGITDEAIGVLLEYEETAFDENKVDETASFTPNYTNGEEYIAFIRNKLKTSKEQTFEDNIEGYIMEALYKGSEFGQVPEAMIQSFKESVESAAAMYGVSLEMYLYYAYGGISTGAQFDELAKFQVCTRAIFGEIIKRENMTITQAEFDESAAVFAENYGYDSVAEFISSATKDNICNSIFINRIMDMLKQNVTIEVIE